MIGIVLWSDPKLPKAVFWCEDQGDLAFYNPLSQGEEGTLGLTAGDVVKFDIKNESQLRLATNAELLRTEQNNGINLPEQLQKAADAKGENAIENAEILRFQPAIRQGGVERALRKA